MLPLETTLAVLILNSDCSISDKELFSHGKSIKQLCVENELIDPREVKFYFWNVPPHNNIQYDLDIIRKRRDDLESCPKLFHSCRFPTRQTALELKAFNVQYREFLENKQIIDPANYFSYQEMIDETKELYDIWSIVDETQSEYYYITVRRQALKKLLDVIGEGAFYDGALPPIVPLWRFQRIN